MFSTQLIRDSKAIGMSFWLIYNPAVVGLFVWIAIDPESSFSFIPASSEISLASHFIGEFAIVNALLVPFVFYRFVIQKSFEQEAGADSFVDSRIFRIDTAVGEEKRGRGAMSSQGRTNDRVHLFWARIFSCFSLTLISFLLPYLSYLCLHLLGLLPEDSLTPILATAHFPVFIGSMALLASAIAVGIGLGTRHKWSVLVAPAVILGVLFAGVVFDAIEEKHDRLFLIKLAERYGSTLSVPVVFLGLSLLIGWLSRATFRHRNTRIR